MSVIFAPVQLFGPLPGTGMAVNSGQEWNFLTALTASVALFEFNLGYAECAVARWLLVWAPHNLATTARLVAFEGASGSTLSGLIELAQIQSLGHTGAVPQDAFFTSKMNELVRAGRSKHIGMQFKGENWVTWRIYESCLELHWRV
jgi:hypothetical protein